MRMYLEENFDGAGITSKRWIQAKTICTKIRYFIWFATVSSIPITVFSIWVVITNAISLQILVVCTHQTLIVPTGTILFRKLKGWVLFKGWNYCLRTYLYFEICWTQLTCTESLKRTGRLLARTDTNKLTGYICHCQ